MSNWTLFICFWSIDDVFAINFSFTNEFLTFLKFYNEKLKKEKSWNLAAFINYNDPRISSFSFVNLPKFTKNFFVSIMNKNLIFNLYYFNLYYLVYLIFITIYSSK